MSPYGYIQSLVIVLLCSGAIRAENAVCTTPRAQSNIHMNQLNGDWFVGQLNEPSNSTLNKNKCFKANVKEINETALESSMAYFGGIARQVFYIENAENAGTWHTVDRDRTVEVIYLSADGTTMVMASCLPGFVKPLCMLMGKQLPISSEETEDVLHVMEVVETPGSRCQFTWRSEATCPST